MTSNPLISIVTPSYNQGEFIEATICSVLNQTYKNIQYIIVDGGSDDTSIEIVNKYKRQIDIVINEKDEGQSDAINKGFKLAKGELIGWLNSDDILYPKCVEKIVELYLNNPGGSIYYCAMFDEIDKYNNVIKAVHVPISNRNYLQHRNYSVVQPGSFYNRDFVEKIGYIDKTIHYCMDLDLWLRLLELGNIHSLNEISYSGFRIWGGTKTSNGGQKFLKDIRNVLRKNNAKFFSRTILQTYWYSFKVRIKSLLN